MNENKEKPKKYCTANRDRENCWLDIGRPDLCWILCWIDNPPQRKEDCEYWEEKEEEEE